MKLKQIFLICIGLMTSFLYAQTKRFYPSPFISLTSDKKIIRENYSYNNEVGGPSEYFYDKDGFMCKKEFIRSDGFRTITSFEYQPDGKLKSSIRTLPDGHKMIFSYAYDDSDHLTCRVSFIDDSLTSKELYLYDPEGFLEKASYQNVDGWLSGKLEFTHTQMNRLETGTYKGMDGLKADILFTYNREGLLLEIKWLFSNGVFQIYAFEYN